MMDRLSLPGLFPEEIAEALNLKPYQGRQIFQWLHRRQVFTFEEMTNLSKELRAQLTEKCEAALLEPVTTVESPKAPGTAKTLFRLRDGETVESVCITDRERITLCLSSQVGCAVQCAFCATGLSGFSRNLEAGEIAEQALRQLAGLDLKERHPNIVYMGMGEPLRNYDAVVKSVRLLMSPDGLNVGARRITISTAGEADGIRKLANENWQVRLSVSLHAGNDDLRTRLVPLNKRYPISKLMDALRHYTAVSGRQITFEWTLLDGVNDRSQDAQELAALAQPLRAAVNLIPYNPVDGAAFSAPPPRKCEQFREQLERLGVNATLRRERGQDVAAACGQLRRRAEGV